MAGVACFARMLQAVTFGPLPTLTTICMLATETSRVGLLGNLAIPHCKVGVRMATASGQVVKEWAAAPHPPCTLVAPAAQSEVQLV